MMTILRSKLKSFKLLMVLVLAYIQQASGGDELIIESAGVSVKALPSPPQGVGKVTGLSGLIGNVAGQTYLTWNPLLHTKTYVVEKSTDNAEWVDAKCPGTRSEVIVTGLASETYSWFRVAGINGMGQGAWSDPVRLEAK